MFRKALVMAAVLLVMTVSVSAQSTMKDADFVKKAIEVFKLDSVQPAFLEGDRMGEYYRFYPAVKGGKVVGYLWWARDFRIANHWEDVILLIKVEGGTAKLADYWFSSNERHQNLFESAVKNRFVGMSYDRNWNETADVVSGSTISSYQFFSQFKTTLFVFQKYVVDMNLIK